MKTLRSIITAIIILAVSVPAAAETYKAVASNLSGQVEIMAVGGNAWVALKNHDQVVVGDQVRTGADGSAIITFDSGNVISLSPLTSITLSELSRNGSLKTSIIDIKSGRMLAYARKLKNPDSVFAVRTPIAYAGVRGSEIAVTVSEGNSLLQIISGSFNVEVNGASAILEAGFQMDILSSMTAPPTPMAIDTAALQSLKKEIGAREEAGSQADALIGAESSTVEQMSDIMDMIDRANHGTCRMHQSCYYDQCYVYEQCDDSY